MILSSVLSAAGTTLGLGALPGTLELSLLTAANLLPARKAAPRITQRKTRLAIVIPAHNERESIGTCLASVLRCSGIQERAVVYVVADNCTDETAQIARAAGVNVLERHNSTLRGKGHALHYAFGQLMQSDFDAFAVVDADSEVDPGFVEALAEAFDRGAQAVQCPYRVAQAQRNPLLDLALRGFNVVRPRGRARLGLSSGILGNGFALSRLTLERVPYVAGSIVEDLEYHLNVVRAGIRVEFLESTWVLGAMPVNDSGRATQRARWEGGRLGMLRQRGGWLVRQALRGRLHCLEVLLDLITMPLAYHLVLLFGALALPSTLGRELAFVGLVALVSHVAAAVAAGNSVLSDLRVLVRIPLYVLWKLGRIPSIVRASGRSVAWVRTARTQEETVHV